MKNGNQKHICYSFTLYCGCFFCFWKDRRFRTHQSCTNEIYTVSSDEKVKFSDSNIWSQEVLTFWLLLCQAICYPKS